MEVNKIESFKYYKMSADQGDSYAQYKLGKQVILNNIFHVIFLPFEL